MDKQLDMKIAQVVYGWNVYEKVGSDINGENEGQVLVPYSGYCLELFKEGYMFPPKGKIAESFFCPRYTSEYQTALELAKKVKLPTPAHELPSSAAELAKLAYEHFTTLSGKEGGKG